MGGLLKSVNFFWYALYIASKEHMEVFVENLGGKRE